MLEAIDNAQHEVLLEMYWIGLDSGGRALPRRADATGAGRRARLDHL